MTLTLLGDIDIPLLITRWIHLAAAIAAIGGAIYARVAVVPGLKDMADQAARDQLRESFRRRWGRVVHVCIMLLVITGGTNFFRQVISAGIKPMPYHAIFGVKLIAALAIFFVASALVGRSSGFVGMRQQAGKWLGVIIALGMLIVLLSGVLSQVRLG